jgi:uncharacterized OB-fold protein
MTGTTHNADSWEFGPPLKPMPAPTAVSAPYWSAIDSGQLRLQQCQSCSGWTFPPSTRCRHCATRDLQWRPTAGTGELLTWSVVHQAPFPSFQGEVPYIVAVVRLDEGPQLMGNLLGVGAEDLAIGRRVRVVFEERLPGRQVPQFVPDDV